MAKPNDAKDIKPKTEGEEKAPAGGPKINLKIDENMKVIIINLVTTVLICLLFLSVNYVLQASLLSSKLAKQTTATGDETATTDVTGDSGEADAQRGFIVDLGDFILNLSDISPRKYLKVNVALEVSSKPEDTAAAPEKKEGAAAASPLDAEMEQFKPAFRDAVITTLSSKSAAELSTVAGKELAKEQITEAINGI